MPIVPYTPEKYLAQIKDVMLWNKVATIDRNYTIDAFRRQCDYVFSEYFETLEAIGKNNKKMVLDGVADLFVTMCHRHTISVAGKLDDAAILDSLQDSPSVDSLKELFEDIRDGDFSYSKDNVDRVHMFLAMMTSETTSTFTSDDGCADIAYNQNLYYYILSVGLLLNVDIGAVIDHVMESNWSKYPKATECDLDAERNHFDSLYGKGVVVPRLNDEFGVYVFRDDFGRGKIRKPTTFVDADCSIFLN